MGPGIQQVHFVIALCNNGMLDLFFKAEYEISGQEIGNVNNSEIAGLLMGAAKYPIDFSTGVGLIKRWASNTADSQIVNTKVYEVRKKYIIGDSLTVVTFSLIMEVENAFDFMENHSKLTYGMRQKLTLVRKLTMMPLKELHELRLEKVH